MPMSGMNSNALETVDIGILTVISPELFAASDALGLGGIVRDKLDNGTVVLRGAVRSNLRECDYRFVLACIGGAGNPASAAAAVALIERFKPRCMILMGIAAGVRGKVRIGEVVLPERVVAYEPAALEQDEKGTRTEQRRPDIERLAHSMKQDVIHYRPDVKRIKAIFKRIAGIFPEAPFTQNRTEWAENVLSAIKVNNGVTLASGEKLLRDPNKLLDVRRDIHGKVEVGEMEAAGIIEACRLYAIPWLIFRGISDFGDRFKDDRFHEYASRTAAAVMADFLVHGLDLGGGIPPAARVSHCPNPFRPGLSIDKEQDFFGRHHERSNITEAMEKGSAVQLLGGTLMGKTSLLHWVERHPPLGRPVVWIDSGEALSPVAMVRAIARKLRRADIVDALGKRSATVHDAAGRLSELMPFVLLVDDADKLAARGREFEEDFFEVVRHHVASRQMAWISASRENLYELFKSQGLTSRFLNTSEKVWLGPLDDESSRGLAGRGPPEHVERMLRVAGGFAHGLQWLGDRLFRSTGGIQDVYDEFEREMKPIMQEWWDVLSPGDRDLVRACVGTGMDAQDVRGDVRSSLTRLVERGYLIRRNGRYRLAPGNTWEGFVRHGG